MKLTIRPIEGKSGEGKEKRGLAEHETAAAEAINEWKMTTSLGETHTAERERDNQI